MGSKGSDKMSEDELRALHQSIEQLNAVSRNNFCEIVSPESEISKNNKRKRTKAMSADVETQTPKKRKRKKLSVSGDVINESDNQIDEILEEIASRKNLTANNVKNLLRNIIANESVQEMLKCSLNENSKLPFEPKLTRSKTKEWIESQNLSRAPSKRLSDTCILMEEELAEDSSDDEYRPCEDEIISEEESFVSSQASDIGSPLSVCTTRPCSTLLEDDNFKRPLPIQQLNEHDLIGSRTRSKLPLNDTPLEHLELAFIPPDISTDMYDSDCDNEEWRNFLKEFACPPKRTTSENVDDEEADPEYNILEEEEEIDDEEMRADRTVQITKKEVRELLSELFEENFSTTDEETKDMEPIRPANIQHSSSDILQRAMVDIMPQVDSNTVESTKTSVKPTGIVQPFPPNPSIGLSFTINFPTIDIAPITVHSTTNSAREMEPSPSYCDETPSLTSEQRALLEEQLRKHVQLLTQMHLITTQQTELAPVAQKCRSMLQELQPYSHYLNICNLDEAVNLVNYWEGSATRMSPENLKKYQFTLTESGNKKKHVNRHSKHPNRCPFNPQMVELMADSYIFIYPQLLPKIAIFQIEHVPCIPSTHEEQLIAMGLEQFLPYCQQLLPGSKTHSNLVWNMISHFMLPHWTPRQIAVRKKRLSMPSAPPNPVKYYVEHKVAPPIQHNVQALGQICKLRDVPPHFLPLRWRELMISNEARCHKKSMFFHDFRPKAPTESPRAIDPSLCLTSLTPLSHEKPKKRKRTKIDKSTRPSKEVAKSPSKSKQLIAIQTPQSPLRHSCSQDENQNQSNDSPFRICSPNPIDDSKDDTPAKNDRRLFSETSRNINNSLFYGESGNHKVCESNEDDDDTDHNQINRNLNVDAFSMNSNSSAVGLVNQPAKRYVLIQRENGSSNQVVHVWGPSNRKQNNAPRAAADNSTQNNKNRGSASYETNNEANSSTPDVPTSSGSGASGTGAGADGDDDGDKPTPNPYVNTIADEAAVCEEEEEEEDDSINLDALNTTPSRPQSAPMKNRSPGHRHIRHQRNARRILDSWMSDDDPASLSNDAYALAYYAKVKNQLEQENPNAFKEFVSTLGDFQSTSSSIAELYKKMQSILGNYPDLMDEFVLFLSPEAAAQCGLQFQHFLYVRMRDFFAKLKVHFKDSPTQLKRALKALQLIETSLEPSIADIKNGILPLLRGNNYLTQVFLQLFVDEPSPPSDPREFEEVNIEQAHSGDEFENVSLCDTSVNLREPDSKGAKRTGSKGLARNKSKGKAWKKV